jgi:hypothetical protein
LSIVMDKLIHFTQISSFLPNSHPIRIF